jgi:hypothetical protein
LTVVFQVELTQFFHFALTPLAYDNLMGSQRN